MTTAFQDYIVFLKALVRDKWPQKILKMSQKYKIAKIVLLLISSEVTNPGLLLMGILLLLRHVKILQAMRGMSTD